MSSLSKNSWEILLSTFGFRGAFNQNTFVEIDNTKHDWGNYFRGPLKAVCEECDLKNPQSFYAMIDGNVPAVMTIL